VELSPNDIRKLEKLYTSAWWRHIMRPYHRPFYRFCWKLP